MMKVITFGEIMLRLSTQYGDRISQTQSFDATYGGAEANVGISLANYGYEVSFVSKVPSNPLGLAAEAHLKSKNVNTKFLLKGGERLGSYYLEVGAGERSSKVIYDRKYSSFSSMKKDEINWDEVFKGVDLFHVSGIAMAISIEVQQIVKVAVTKAKEFGVKVSFDFNYRAGLWSQSEAAEAYKMILSMVDICSASELDAIYLLKIKKADEVLSTEEKLVYYYKKIRGMYPNIKILTSTTRKVISSSENELIGYLLIKGKLYTSKLYYLNPIVDRVGSGDAYMSGIIYGYLENMPPHDIVGFATAAGALKHTVNGDCNVFSENEVKEFLENGSGKIDR